MTNPANHPAIGMGDPAHYAIEEKKMYLDAGTLGKFFGTSANAASNVAALVVCVLLLAVVGLFLLGRTDQAIEYFKLVSPLLTLALGFMFGKKSV